MKVRAAVLEEFGQPLVVQELVTSARARRAQARRGARPAGCLRRLPRGHVHGLRRRPERLRASRARTRGCRRRGEGRRGRHARRAGRPRRDLVLAPLRRVRPLPESKDEPLPGDSGHAGPGLLTGRDDSLSRNGDSIRYFMGTSTFADYTVMPEIALAKISKEARLDRACLFACGLSTGIGAALRTARVEPGSTCVVFGAGMVGLGAIVGCRLAGAGRIIAIDLSEERLALTRGHGATETLVGGDDIVERVVELTGGSAPNTPIGSRMRTWLRTEQEEAASWSTRTASPSRSSRRSIGSALRSRMSSSRISTRIT
jgi:S-(hydroxymethyl)glutathione dehydrogenase / alcohol dehydrogenase